jgi:hypothetical protein
MMEPALSWQLLSRKNILVVLAVKLTLPGLTEPPLQSPGFMGSSLAEGPIHTPSASVVLFPGDVFQGSPFGLPYFRQDLQNLLSLPGAIGNIEIPFFGINQTPMLDEPAIFFQQKSLSQ